MAQAEGVSSTGVRSAVASLIDREKALVSNLATITTSVTTAADYLAVLGDKEKVATYKELMSSLGQLTHEVKSHQHVLSELGLTYQASMEPTDFKAELDQRMREQLQRQPYDPRADAAMQEFLSAVGAAEGPSGAGGNEELDDEEDLLVLDGGRKWMNDKCILSLRDVFDLDQPVIDKKGYVFERAAIEDWVRRKPAGQAHPAAGVTYVLRLDDLVVAKDVERVKRLRRLRGTGGGGGGGGEAGGRDENYIDV